MFGQYQGELTWNMDWVTKFESPWGTFEKFKYANAAMVKDIILLFGTPEAKISKNSLRKNHRDLITLEGIDENSTNDLLGLSLINVYRDNLNNIIGILPKNRNGERIYFSKHLVFCTKCLSKGYHSLFHQFVLLDYCPIHMIGLKEVCPECNRKIPYILSDEYTKSPFQCICGHIFLETNNALKNFSLWKEIQPFKINDVTTERWLSVNRKKNIKKSKIYFLPDFYLDSNKKILKNLITALSQNSLIGENHYSMVRFNQSQESAYQFTWPEIQDLQEKMYRSSLTNFKSIVRHLKKTVLSEHKTCIARFKKMAPDKEICPYAYAFVHWRMNVERLKEYWEVENSEKLRKTYPYAYLPKQDQFYLDKIIDELQSNFPDLINQKGVLWLLNKIICIIIHNHFKNWLHIANEYACQNTICHNRPFQFESLPFILLEMNQLKEQQKKITFFIFPNEQKTFQEIKCPFQSVRQRRNARNKLKKSADLT